MAKSKCLIKEVLALVMICILCSTEVNTKKMPKPNFPIRVTLQEPSLKLKITSILTKKALKIKMLPHGENYTKYISLPLPLNENWTKTIKMGQEPAEYDKNKKGKDNKNKKGKDNKNKKGKDNKNGQFRQLKGKKGKHGRIVGGKEVDPPHSFPWQVALVEKRKPTFAQCGATIICPRYILTAAHCLELTNRNRDPKDILIVAGAHNIRDRSEKTRTEHKVSKFFIHPKRGQWSYDYAILDLADHIHIRKEAKSAHLPVVDDQKTLSEKTLIVSGWGDLENDAMAGSAVLMKAEVPFVSDKECMDTWGDEIGEGKESLFCAGYMEEGGIDACQGDSGGPLVMVDGDKLKHIGVVAAGGDCGEPNQPGLYSKITLVLDWINKKTGGCNAKVCKKGKCVTRKDLGPAEHLFRSTST